MEDRVSTTCKDGAPDVRTEALRVELDASARRRLQYLIEDLEAAAYARDWPRLKKARRALKVQAGLEIRQA